MKSIHLCSRLLPAILVVVVDQGLRGQGGYYVHGGSQYLKPWEVAARASENAEYARRWSMRNETYQPEVRQLKSTTAAAPVVFWDRDAYDADRKNEKMQLEVVAISAYERGDHTAAAAAIRRIEERFGVRTNVRVDGVGGMSAQVRLIYGYLQHYGQGGYKVDLSAALDLYATVSFLKPGTTQQWTPPGLTATRWEMGYATYQTARLYDQGGEGVAQDAALAVRLYEIAAERGIGDAYDELGDHHLYGIGVTKDLAKARSCYEMGVSRSSIHARAMLGYLCLQSGDAAEIAKARSLIEAAASEGHVFGQYLLGECHQYGIGGDADYGKAMVWYQRAADRGMAKARTAIGYMHEKGLGVPVDVNQAAALYQKSLEVDSYAALRLGFFYSTGNGKPKNLYSALYCFHWAEKLGSPQGAEMVASIREASLRYAEQRHPEDAEAFYVWNYYDAQGLSYPGIKRIQAEYNLSLCFREGIGCEKDPEAADRFFRTAVRHAHPEALCIFARQLEADGSTDLNRALALWMYRLSARQGNQEAARLVAAFEASAQALAGDATPGGKGCSFLASWVAVEANTQSLPEDLQFWQKQVAATASWEIARCHREGIGVSRDAQEMWKWVEKAAKYGLPEAVEAVKKKP